LFSGVSFDKGKHSKYFKVDLQSNSKNNNSRNKKYRDLAFREHLKKHKTQESKDPRDQGPKRPRAQETKGPRVSSHKCPKCPRAQESRKVKVGGKIKPYYSNHDFSPLTSVYILLLF
jgi:hypothetical protein